MPKVRPRRREPQVNEDANDDRYADQRFLPASESCIGDGPAQILREGELDVLLDEVDELARKRVAR